MPRRAFSPENSSFLSGLVQNGNIDGVPAGVVQERYATYFKDINPSTFRSRLAKLRKENGKKKDSGAADKGMFSIFLFFYFSNLTLSFSLPF